MKTRKLLRSKTHINFKIQLDVIYFQELHWEADLRTLQSCVSSTSCRMTYSITCIGSQTCINLCLTYSDGTIMSINSTRTKRQYRKQGVSLLKYEVGVSYWSMTYFNNKNLSEIKHTRQYNCLGRMITLSHHLSETLPDWKFSFVSGILSI